MSKETDRLKAELTFAELEISNLKDELRQERNRSRIETEYLRMRLDHLTKLAVNMMNMTPRPVVSLKDGTIGEISHVQDGEPK